MYIVKYEEKYVKVKTNFEDTKLKFVFYINFLNYTNK